MLRLTLIALMLAPGAAHAQKILSSSGEDLTESLTGATPTAASLVDDVDDALFGGSDDIIEGEVYQSSEVARTFDVQGEECNPGTTWDSSAALCWNAYPTGN